MSSVEKTSKKSRYESFKEGVVTSDKADKTRVVSVTRVVQHPRFKKVMKRQVKYVVHDEKNESKAGDKVQIIQSRPISKTKRWVLKKIVG